MASQRPRVSIRFDTKAQLDRVTRAARIRKWTINQFVLEAAELEAGKLLTTDVPSEQLMVKSSRQPLNQ